MKGELEVKEGDIEMSKSVKRLAAPKHWKIARKTTNWAVKPSPGPHPWNFSIPLLMVVRDMLKLAETYREARIIIKRGEVTVDGVQRRNHKFPVGLMDIVGIPKLNSYYRVVPTTTKLFFKLIPVPEKERNLKICKINRKKTVKEGNIQLTLHDGRNILLKVKNPANPVEDVYKRLDSLEITVPNQEIKDHLPFKEGNTGLVFKGKNMGKIGEIKEIRKERREYIVTMETLDKGETFSTTADSVIIVGKDKPSIVVA